MYLRMTASIDVSKGIENQRLEMINYACLKDLGEISFVIGTLKSSKYFSCIIDRECENAYEKENVSQSEDFSSICP